MSKSIVVINTPKNCRVCPFRESPWSFCLGEYEKEKHCPLKPLPQKKQHGEEIDYEYGYIDGWNDCLGEITGETQWK